MVQVRLAHEAAFSIIGVKTWISGTDNELFARFWQEQTASGTTEDLGRYRAPDERSVTKSKLLGLSNTENDPAIRSFDFYIAVESEQPAHPQGSGYELLRVRPYTWAIFSAEWGSIDSLIQCEMYCWAEWLPGNGRYRHALGPELEVYRDTGEVEYWVPVVPSEAR